MLHGARQNQLLALDKENNTIQTTIHTNLLVDNFYQTSNGSNNNLCLSEMDDYTANNANSSTMQGNLMNDGSECSMEECNNTNCNYISNNENENDGGYGELWAIFFICPASTWDFKNSEFERSVQFHIDIEWKFFNTSLNDEHDGCVRSSK